MNLLYFGDNLDILRRHIAAASVDLVYLDPPFNSNQNYNVLFAEKDGTAAAAQICAFEDTWHWDMAAAESFTETVEAGGEVSKALQAFRDFIGENDMLAYLSMMAPRLVELRRVLKPTGSLYLHCDPTASHYLKLLLDAVFGPERFINEVVWRRYGAHNDVGQGSKHFGRVHDILLFYGRSAEMFWEQQFTPLSEKYTEKNYRYVDAATGRRYTTTPLTGPGGAAKGNPVFEWNGHTRAWRYSKETMLELHDAGLLHYSKTGYARKKLFLEDSRGVPVQDLWDDPKALTGAHAERLGYPTQKPVALLERIIATSCPGGGVVLDPFCGCGTTVDAAEKLGREWIGIDITHLAITLIKHRLRDSYADTVTYEVHGEPASVSGAAELAGSGPDGRYQFEWWALGLVGARPEETKKGADKGVDGRLFFHDEPGGPTKRIVISVKSGKVGRPMLDQLLGVMEKEKAEIGVFLTLEPPTKPMRELGASAGFYDSPWGKHPRLQILTIDELLEGKGIDYPPVTGANVTYNRAPRHERKVAEQMDLTDADPE